MEIMINGQLYNKIETSPAWKQYEMKFWAKGNKEAEYNVANLFLKTPSYRIIQERWYHKLLDEIHNLFVLQ